MSADVLKFPLHAVVRSIQEHTIPHPPRTTIMLPEMTLCIDHREHTYESLPAQEEDTGAPQLFAQGDEVVLDLGDCTPMRTVITLDPDTALTWAAGLIAAAEEARKAK